MAYTLHHGDCLEVLPTLAAGSADAVITDPPYLTSAASVPVRGHGVAAPRNGSVSVGSPWGYALDWIEAARRLQPRHWIVFCNYRMLGGVCSALEAFAVLSTVFVWRRSNAPSMARPVPRLDCEFIVWARDARADCGRMGEFNSQLLDVPGLPAGCFASERILKAGSGVAAHPAQKPLAVVEPFVRRLNIETVLDPFMGSGTTGEACINTGRDFIGIEKDAGYYAIAERRLTEAAARLHQMELAV